MRALEQIDDSNWRDFTGSAAAVLMLALSDCPACRAWTDELERFVAEDDRWDEVRVGKIVLDGPGVEAFKRENDWLDHVEGVPFNVIFVEGQPRTSFAGKGIERLTRRLQRHLTVASE